MYFHYDLFDRISIKNSILKSHLFVMRNSWYFTNLFCRIQLDIIIDTNDVNADITAKYLSSKQLKNKFNRRALQQGPRRQ
jgi:hypothetical protein